MQLWVARGGRIFFFWYLGPILGGPGCTLALCYLHGSCWQLTTDLCWPFKRDQGGPECGAGVCAYMHVHVLEEKFFIAQFRGPPWQGWTGINKQWRVAKRFEFPPKINMLSSNFFLLCFMLGWWFALMYDRGHLIGFDPANYKIKKSDSLYFVHCLAFFLLPWQFGQIAVHSVLICE